MATGKERDFLKDPRVVEEIKRHLWIESEKAGYDVGFEYAAKDWIKKYSNEWIKYNMTEKKKNSQGNHSKSAAKKHSRSGR